MSGVDASQQQEARPSQPQPVSLGAHTPKSRSSPNSLPPGHHEDTYEVEEVDDFIMADAR